MDNPSYAGILVFIGMWAGILIVLTDKDLHINASRISLGGIICLFFGVCIGLGANWGFAIGQREAIRDNTIEVKELELKCAAVRYDLSMMMLRLEAAAKRD